MQLPGRKFTAANSGYRYGFNGKENDNDVKGEGNQQDYGMRIYDPRLGKFLSVDPLTPKYPWYTPYQFAGNRPTEAIDIDGLEPGDFSLTPGMPEPSVQIEYHGTANDPIGRGVDKSVKKTWNFITKDAWKLQTWKNMAKFAEQGALSTSTVPIAPTPMVDAKVDDFMTNVINGNITTRLEYISEFGTDVFTAWAGSKGAGVVKSLFVESNVFKGLGAMRSPAITPGFGESTLIDYGGGLASRKFSTFTNIIKGAAGDGATKYLWTIDQRGINIALEQTPAKTFRGFITHTNISSAAAAGGEVWFTGEKSVFINPKSARFGGSSMTVEQWNATKAAWEKIGYKVEAADFKPPSK